LYTVNLVDLIQLIALLKSAMSNETSTRLDVEASSRPTILCSVTSQSPNPAPRPLARSYLERLNALKLRITDLANRVDIQTRWHMQILKRRQLEDAEAERAKEKKRAVEDAELEEHERALAVEEKVKLDATEIQP